MIKRTNQQLYSIRSDRQRIFDVKYPKKNLHLFSDAVIVADKPKSNTLNIFWGAFAIVVTVLMIHRVVQAGSLSPSASPAATMYTIGDIYTRLTTNATATLGDHVFTPGASPASTLYTFTQIYTAIPTIDPDKVDVGTTYLGVAGTLLASLFNGSSGGASQASGGSDDYNNGGAELSGRYEKGWTTCNAGNTYCGTSDAEADMKDNSTGLVWSMPCNGLQCSSFSDASPITYSWDSSAVNNNGKTASQLCSDQTGWSLPHQKQLIQTYINGSYINLEASGVSRAYWSASAVSTSALVNAWHINLSTGEDTSQIKTGSHYIRCIR